MIKEGCLEGVDEIYGLHNSPNFHEGDIRVKEGCMMAASSEVKIYVRGKGGHSSIPHKINDVINASMAILSNLHILKSRFLDSKENVVFSICHVQSGHTYNVFPDEAFMEGTVRSYNEEVLKVVEEKIK